MVFLQSSLGVFVLACQCIGGVQGMRRRHAEDLGEAAQALTQQELDSLAWVRAEDRPLCQFFMAKCKVNKTACNLGCTTTAPIKDFGRVEEGSRIAGFDPDVFDVNATGDLGDLVGLGELIWTIIQDSKPVSDISNKHVSILEKNSGFSDYSGWRDRRSRTERVVETRNTFGQVVSSVDATMVFNFGGRFRGRGRYVKNCWTSTRVDVGFGNSVEAKATRLDPINRGTRSNPCAEANIMFSFTFGSWVKKWTVDYRFKYRCDGYWEMEGF